MAGKRIYLTVYAIFAFSITSFLQGRFRLQLPGEGNGVKQRLIKVHNSRIYIYSAVAVFMHHSFETAEKSKRESNFNAIAISAFEIGNDSALPFRCCLMLRKGVIVSFISAFKNTHPAKAIRRGIQFICTLRDRFSDIQKVTLTFKNTPCPVDEQYYEDVIIPKPVLKRNENDKAIAVCAKLSYGDLDADMLIEWLEALRMFGVDKIFTHLYMLNTHARTVFQYYKSIGFVETMEFDLPEKEIQSEINTNYRQGWHDEQVALFNCQVRLLMYDYVVVLDTDEFLVPTADVFRNGWRTLFDKVFSKSDIASVYFWTVLHITMWKSSNPGHPLFIGKYNNCTVPLIDREKHVYIPTKIELGSIFTHTNTPLEGYKRNEVDPKIAVVHHFRSCRKEWLEPRSLKYSRIEDWLGGRAPWLLRDKENDYFFYLKAENYCYDFRRFNSKDIEKLSTMIKENVTRAAETFRETNYLHN